jgi:hypothetical protein
MRISQKALLSCAVVAVATLLAGSLAMAGGSHSKCSSFSPSVTVLAGPCPVTSATNPTECAASGDYTGIKYKVEGDADHVATVVTANNTVVGPSGVQVYDPCKGDPITGLGNLMCNVVAVKVNPDALTGEFWLVVDKSKAAVLQSIVVKKGSCVKPFAIAGLGYEINPFVQTQKTETINFKG